MTKQGHNVPMDPAKRLLLIFTRNPELGQCKTRLAATVGDKTALEIYIFLLNHTVTVTKDLAVTKQVYYSNKIHHSDVWQEAIFDKKLQQGTDLGERMLHAFADGFDDGYEQIIVIGSDLYDLSSSDLHKAFHALNSNDYVLGPAEDGGYYLLGMRQLNPTIFQNKKWGTSTVLKDTLSTLENEKVQLLDLKNDVDYYEDIKDIDIFQQFLKHMNSN